MDGVRLNGSHVAETLLGQSAAERDIPILVHSMNVKCGQEMAQRLEDASYPVTRILLSDLSRERFLEWLEEVREELEADWAGRRLIGTRSRCLSDRDRGARS